MIEKLNLARIEALAKKASPGPWEVEEDLADLPKDFGYHKTEFPDPKYAEIGIHGRDDAPVVPIRIDYHYWEWDAADIGNWHNDAPFIASARSSVPALAAKLREARELLENRYDYASAWAYSDFATLNEYNRAVNAFLDSISWKDKGDASEETK